MLTNEQLTNINNKLIELVNIYRANGVWDAALISAGESPVIDSSRIVDELIELGVTKIK
jgi:hypothetical protein